MRLILALLLLHAGLHAETVTRGPYLQLATPDRVTVRWRSDVASSGRVHYGTSATTLDRTVTETAATTEHSLTLDGLNASTAYWYDVGNATTVLAGGTSCTFIATPTGTSTPLRLWALGDCGTGNGDAKAVRDAFYVWNRSTRADVTLLLGDNAYDNGTDAQFQKGVFGIYPATLRQGVFWATIGNHDTNQSTNPAPTIPYFRIFTNPSGGEAGGVPSRSGKYYSFDHGPVHVVCLDSMTSSRSLTSASVRWTPEPWVAIGSTGAESRTPDLADLVLAVVVRPGWASGNTLAFVISGSGKRVAQSRNLAGGIPAQLRVVWMMPAAPVMAPVVGAIPHLPAINAAAATWR